MPVEVGYVPAGAAPSAHGVDVPAGLPASTTDVLISAPKTVSVLYAVLAVRERFKEADRVLAAHHAGVDAAIDELNYRSSAALVYRTDPRQTPSARLAQMLEREPDAIPERREDLVRQVGAELRDPAVVEHRSRAVCGSTSCFTARTTTTAATHTCTLICSSTPRSSASTTDASIPVTPKHCGIRCARSCNAMTSASP